MKKILLIIAFALIGCAPNNEKGLKWEVTVKKIIPSSKTEIASDWIINVVRAANPMSDEEPEDNIEQAEETAFNLFGESIWGIFIWRNGKYSGFFIPYDKCTEWQKALINNYKRKIKENPLPSDTKGKL